jgi:NAD-dependent SIR2 family protein deacetylase
MTEVYAAAAAAVRSARALVVTAGAGMGVDSGLPDFRGDQGFWKAYPPYERLGISFIDAANPAHFEADRRSAGGSTATARGSTATRRHTRASRSCAA